MKLFVKIGIILLICLVVILIVMVVNKNKSNGEKSNDGKDTTTIGPSFTTVNTQYSWSSKLNQLNINQYWEYIPLFVHNAYNTGGTSNTDPTQGTTNDVSTWNTYFEIPSNADAWKDIVPSGKVPFNIGEAMCGAFNITGTSTVPQYPNPIKRTNMFIARETEKSTGMMVPGPNGNNYEQGAYKNIQFGQVLNNYCRENGYLPVNNISYFNPAFLCYDWTDLNNALIEQNIGKHHTSNSGEESQVGCCNKNAGYIEPIWPSNGDELNLWLLLYKQWIVGWGVCKETADTLNPIMCHQNFDFTPESSDYAYTCQPEQGTCEELELGAQNIGMFVDFDNCSHSNCNTESQGILTCSYIQLKVPDSLIVFNNNYAFWHDESGACLGPASQGGMFEDWFSGRGKKSVSSLLIAWKMAAYGAYTVVHNFGQTREQNFPQFAQRICIPLAAFLIYAQVNSAFTCGYWVSNSPECETGGETDDCMVFGSTNKSCRNSNRGLAFTPYDFMTRKLGMPIDDQAIILYISETFMYKPLDPNSEIDFKDHIFFKREFEFCTVYIHFSDKDVVSSPRSNCTKDYANEFFTGTGSTGPGQPFKAQKAGSPFGSNCRFGTHALIEWINEDNTKDYYVSQTFPEPYYDHSQDSAKQPATIEFMNGLAPNCLNFFNAFFEDEDILSKFVVSYQDLCGILKYSNNPGNLDSRANIIKLSDLSTKYNVTEFTDEDLKRYHLDLTHSGGGKSPIVK